MSFELSPEYEPYRQAITTVLQGTYVPDLDKIRLGCHADYMQKHPTFELDGRDADVALSMMSAALSENLIAGGLSPSAAYGPLARGEPYHETRDLARRMLETIVETAQYTR